MPFRASSIQSKLLEDEYTLPFSSLLSKPKSDVSRKDSMADRNPNHSAEDGLLAQPQTETSWRYKAKRTRVVLVFVVNMAISAALGMLLCMVVVWIGRAWGWGFVGGVAGGEIDEWDD